VTVEHAVPWRYCNRIEDCRKLCSEWLPGDCLDVSAISKQMMLWQYATALKRQHILSVDTVAQTVYEYIRRWQFCMNAEKSAVMHVAPNQHQSPLIGFRFLMA
jgi:hypothetical protein